MKLASIRKIDFSFSNLNHSALVSVAREGEKTFVHIQLIYSFLRNVFGVEHIRFYNFNGEIKLKDERYPFVYQIAQLIDLRVSEAFPTRSLQPLRIV